MINIKVSKKIDEAKKSDLGPDISDLCAFKIKGEWFGTGGGSSSNQENIFLVKTSVFMSIVESNYQKLVKTSTKLPSPSKRPKIPLSCKIAKEIILNNGIAGLVSYDKTEAIGHGPCNGSYEIIRRAGRGYGKLLVRLALAAVYPSPLTPDRESITGELKRMGGKLGVDAAKGAWMEIAADKKVKSVPQNYEGGPVTWSDKLDKAKRKDQFIRSIGVFDNIEGGNTSAGPINITRPKEDDCLMNYTNDELNKGYIDNSYSGQLSQLISKGSALKTDVDSKFSNAPNFDKMFNAIFKALARAWFRYNYSGYLPDDCENTGAIK